MANLFETVPKLKFFEDRKSPFLENINKAIEYAADNLKEIKNTFDNYTNHDIEHSLSVIKYMCDAVTDLNELSDLEITIIIYTGLFHDIGMIATDEEKEVIKNNRYRLSPYNYSCVLDNCGGNEALAIQEIIRPIHAIRSKEFIFKKMEKQKSFFEVPEANGVYFDEIVADICVAHNEEFEWLKLNLDSDIKLGKYSVNSQFIAILLRLADLLDIDSSRAPDYIYDLISPKGVSDDEWRQHFIITNSEKIVDTANNIKSIEFYGSTEDAKIHRKLLNYIDWIKKELENATTYLNTSSQAKHHLNISTNIRNFIKPKNFEASNLKLSLEYKSITNLLMGENIYNNKKCGLREIIQNSIDACKLMKEEAKNLEEYKYSPYAPKIIIRLDEKQKTASIYDNGIGMSFDILKKYFLNVGVSYYTSNDCKYRGYSYTPIGNYGIGFLACFMLSDSIRIVSRRFDCKDTYIVDVEKNNEYVIFNKVTEGVHSFTEITLDQNFFNEFENAETVKEYIEQTFLSDDIDIIVQTGSNDNYTSISCNLMTLENGDEDEIDLSKYLEDIDVRASINKKGRFVTSLNDISNENFVYMNGKLSKYNKDEHSIKDLIDNNKLNWVNIIVVPESMEEKVDYYYEALYDYGEAVERLDSYEIVNIYYNPSQTSFCCNEQYLIVHSNYRNFTNSYNTVVFEEEASILTVEELLSTIDTKDWYENDVYAIYTVNKQENIAGINDNCFVLFDNDSYFFSHNSRNLFVRNVLIGGYNLAVPQIIDGLRIRRITANVLNKSVIPDISRSTIQSEITQKINYAIGKALHLWIYENMPLEPNEKNALKEFINLNYSQCNDLVAREYDGIIQ